MKGENENFMKSPKAYIKKAVSLLIVTAVIAAAFSSCAGEDKNTLLSFHGETLSVGMFSYMLASQKAYVRHVFKNYTNDYYALYGTFPYGTDDFDEFLNTPFPGSENGGLTYAENALETVRKTAFMFVVANYFCKKHRLFVTDPDRIADIEQTVNADIDAAGGLVLLNEALAKYSATAETEREYLYNMEYVGLFYDYLYGSRGTRRLPDSTVAETFFQNYRKIDFVYYPYYAYDTVTGEKTYYDEELIADINAKADDLFQKLAAGEIAFDAYAAHDDYARYDKGLCFAPGDLDGALESAADRIAAPGGVEKAALADGVYLVRLLEPDDDSLASYYDEIYEKLAQTAYYEYLESFYSEIEVDEEKLNEYDFALFDELDLT